jgi:hypothetical protein
MIDQLIALRKPITSAIINPDELSTRQSWWIKHPQAALKLGYFLLILFSSCNKRLLSFVFEGMGREPKKTPSLRLPSLALLCGYSIHPNFLIKARGIS